MNLVSLYRKEGDSDGSMTGAHFVEHRIPNSMYIKHKLKQKIEGGISMHQSIRKTVSLLLAVVLILACGVMAVAAAPKTAEQQASCTHSWNAGYKQQIGNRRKYYSNEKCGWYYVTTKSCIKCGATTVSYSYEDLKNHSGYIKDADCNGTTQTHTYLCDHCDSNYTKTVPCPRPHPGRSCSYLPI